MQKAVVSEVSFELAEHAKDDTLTPTEIPGEHWQTPDSRMRPLLAESDDLALAQFQTGPDLQEGQ